MRKDDEIIEVENSQATAKSEGEAAAYFRARPGFKRLFEGLVAKYCSLGRLSGTVRLEQITPEERLVLEAFFRRSFPEDPVRVSISQFKRALAETRFEGVDPVALLVAWRGEAIITRQDRRDRLELARQTALERLLGQFPEVLCQAWLKAALAKHPGTRQLQRAFRNDSDFTGTMTTVLRALAHLPAEYQRLPVFAARICGDPHGLDPARSAGKLLLEALRYLRQAEPGRGNDADGLSAVEEDNGLWYHFKLLRDDVLNFATCFGLAAYGEKEEIAYWRQAAKAGAPLNIPLRELVRVVSFSPAMSNRDGFFKVGQDPVFMVENSGVFSALLDEESAMRRVVICLHGQFKLASWALLDRLIQSGATLHYSGDFDPEGLQMAEKLLYRYPGRVYLWRMSAADYRRAEPSIPLDEVRLRKLASIRHSQLRPVTEAIAAGRLAAYQEGLLELMVQDMKDGNFR